MISEKISIVDRISVELLCVLRSNRVVCGSTSPSPPVDRDHRPTGRSNQTRFFSLSKGGGSGGERHSSNPSSDHRAHLTTAMEFNPTPYRGDPSIPHVNEELFKVILVGVNVRGEGNRRA